MNPRTSLTTATGKMIDLLDPKAEDIDFSVIAEHLAKANRYCGATADLTYSVAEHCVRGAEIAFDRGEMQLVCYFLCHDMHEAFLGDDTTPKKRALEKIAAGSFGTLAEAVRQAFDHLTDRLDGAIHEAAGLAWPPTNEMQKQIKEIDALMLALEWRDLMRCPPPYDFGVTFPQALPFEQPIRPWEWQVARGAFGYWCRHALPVYRKSSIAHAIETSGAA